jgi:hypothetical protein
MLEFAEVRSLVGPCVYRVSTSRKIRPYHHVWELMGDCVIGEERRKTTISNSVESRKKLNGILDRAIGSTDLVTCRRMVRLARLHLNEITTSD